MIDVCLIGSDKAKCIMFGCESWLFIIINMLVNKSIYIYNKYHMAKHFVDCKKHKDSLELSYLFINLHDVCLRLHCKMDILSIY